MSNRCLSICILNFLFACGAPQPMPEPFSAPCDANIVQPASITNRFSGAPIYSDAQMNTLCKPADVVTNANGSCTKLCAPTAILLKVCDASGAVFYLGADGGPSVVNYGTIEVKGAQCGQIVIGPLQPAQLSKPLDCVTKAPASWGSASYRVYTGPVNCSYPPGLPS